MPAHAPVPLTSSLQAGEPNAEQFLTEGIERRVVVRPAVVSHRVAIQAGGVAQSGRTACGILDVIAGKTPLKDTIWKEPCTNLVFLPAGIKSQLACSNNVLSSEAAQNFFDHLRQAYDYIIVDLPPLAPVVDVRSTARFVDFYTLVIEWGRTKIDLVEHAISGAPVVYEHLLGVVLNKVDINRLASYEGSRRKYYLRSINNMPPTVL